jgi:restriction system protein
VAHAGGFVAIGWDEFDDLGWLRDADDATGASERLIEEYQQRNSTTRMQTAIGAGQLVRFVREMQVGDTIVLPNSSAGVIHLGEVSGPYQFVVQPADTCPQRHRRPVRWLKTVSRQELPQTLINSLGCSTTVFNLDNRAEILKGLLAGVPQEGGSGGTPPTSVVEHVLRRLHAMHPKDFEAFVASYFQAIGYDATSTPYVGDGGIDVAGYLDAEGLAKVLLRVQVKRKRTSVGIETVLKTRGALAVDEQGAIVALGGFTAQARAEAEAQGKKTIVLVDGERFVELVLEHWEDLTTEARTLLGVLPKERLPVRERFMVAG